MTGRERKILEIYLAFVCRALRFAKKINQNPAVKSTPEC